MEDSEDGKGIDQKATRASSHIDKGSSDGIVNVSMDHSAYSASSIPHPSTGESACNYMKPHRDNAFDIQSPNIESSSSDKPYVPYYSCPSIDSVREAAEQRSESSMHQTGLTSSLGDKLDPFHLFGRTGRLDDRNSLGLVPIAEANHEVAQRREYYISSQGNTSEVNQFPRPKNIDLALDWLRALHDSDVDAVKYLLENWPQPNFLLVVGTGPDTAWVLPLHTAALKSLEITKLLLEHGVKVDTTLLLSGTALQRVVKEGRHELKLPIARLLIQSGANVNARASVSGTALSAAVEIQDSTLVRLLLEHGADPNQSCGDNYLYFPLDFAYRRGDFGIISMLREYGANKETRVRTEAGVTTKISLLIHAAASGNEDGALLLLAQGADPSRLDEKWYLTHRLRNGEIPQMPDYLKIWQMSTDGKLSPTFQDLVSHLPGKSFDPNDYILAFDWEVPEVISRHKTMGKDARKFINFTEDVIFLASSTSSGAFGAHEALYFEASSLSEHLCSLGAGDSNVDFISTIIGVLNDVDFDDLESGYCFQLQRSPSIRVTCFKTKITIQISKGAELSKVYPLIQSLELLCKAVRKPTSEHKFTLSKANFRLIRQKITSKKRKRESDTDIELERYVLEIHASLDSRPLMDVENNCWQVLLDSCVVVDCGRKSQSQSLDGKGIQLNFDLMVTLAAVEFSMVVDGGIIFVGYQTALIPIKILDGCAQFHLITSHEGQIDPYECVHAIEDRLLTEDPLVFKDMICFLGWCEFSQINLGTRVLNRNIGYSGGKKKEKSVELNGFTLTAFGGAPNNIASVQIQANYNFRSHIVHFPPLDNYRRLLFDTSKQLAFIYDSEVKRSWIVPKLSLLYHMAQAYILHEAEISDDETLFVNPYSDANEIVETLFEIGGTNYGNDDQPFLFRNLMIGFNINLITATRNLRKSSRNKLHGFEFLDIIKQPDRGACMKRHDFCWRGNSWVNLVNLVDSVIVCSNFGDAITPTRTNSRLCSRCNSLPKNCNYLATTGYCLKRLLNQDPKMAEEVSVVYQTSDRVLWNMKGDPFQNCCHKDDSTSTCWEREDVLQELIWNRWNLRKNAAPMAGQSTVPSTAGIVFI